MLSSPSLAEQVFVEVRDRIIRGDLDRGSAIRQDALAAELGVSKIPVREALVRLQSEGLLVLSRNRGFTVRRLPLSEAVEVFELRIKLEPEAAALGARFATGEEQARAASILAELDAAMKQGTTRVPELNRAFHRALIAPCARPLTLEFLERLLTRFCLQVGQVPRFDLARREHGELLAAWRGRDEEKVRHLTAAHLRATLDKLVMDRSGNSA
jgi:DNA-binding GntR family transcriptional regulator